MFEPIMMSENKCCFWESVWRLHTKFQSFQKRIRSIINGQKRLRTNQYKSYMCENILSNLKKNPSLDPCKNKCKIVMRFSSEIIGFLIPFLPRDTICLSYRQYWRHCGWKRHGNRISRKNTTLKTIKIIPFKYLGTGLSL